MAVIRVLSNVINVAASLVALYSALFFWTRGWVGFIPQSLPWLIYTLLPYITFWFLSKKLQKNNVSMGRNILFLVTAISLFAFTAYAHLQLTDEYMIFYLRQLLFLFPPISLLIILLIVSIGGLLTRHSSGTPNGAP